MTKSALVLKFGGSATTTLDGLNLVYLADFFARLDLDLTKIFEKVVLVVGGGSRSRQALATAGPEAALAVTRDHAHELNLALRQLDLSGLTQGVVAGLVPTNHQELRAAIIESQLVAVGGLELGQSTDAVALSAAQILDELGCEVAIVVLSNVAAIYTQDPKKAPEAKQIACATLDQLVELGVLVDNPSAFKHGMNVPLDPIAVHRYANINHQPLYFAGAADIEGVRNFLTHGEQNSGTLVKRGLDLCLR